jgi:hypothetical protein
MSGDNPFIAGAARGLAAAIQYGYPQSDIDDLTDTLADWLVNPPYRGVDGFIHQDPEAAQ